MIVFSKPFCTFYRECKTISLKHLSKWIPVTTSFTDQVTYGWTCMIKSILVADDDLDFRLIIRLALEARSMHFVDDCLEFMDFLNHQGKYFDSEIPDLIILDLNMPRKNGREALHEIKADPALTSIPIVILSVASSKEDLQLSRDFDCPFIRKPDSYSQWVNAMEALLKFYGTDDVKGDP